ncbi:IS110 family transposase [Hydrogenophaga sp. 5NK40-0174]|uniref:IS110 family transposase n=1 Tax=Hydrogenophaga sp. 5NK40-0174 TaxID=3127649 RepID=UPI00310BE4E0
MNGKSDEHFHPGAHVSHVLGIDVSKAKLDVALLSSASGKVKSRVFKNSPQGFEQLHQWLIDRDCSADQLHVCMEATGPYCEGVATYLCDQGWSVSVVNPARVKGFAQGTMQRNKTDKADASLLARFALLMQPEAWQPAPVEVRELRSLIDRLQALKDMLQQERNRLEAVGEQDAMRESLLSHIDWLKRSIAELESKIDDHIDRHPDLKRDAELIASIPGMGSITAAKVLAYLGDVQRFKNAKALAAFVGVTPKLKESGTSVRGRSVIARSGHAAVRHALFMPSMVARRHNPLLKTFGDRLAAEGLRPKAVILACMHKLVRMIYGVLKSGRAFDARFLVGKLDIQDGI